MIPDDRLRELYREAFKDDGWRLEWRASYLSFIENVKRMSDGVLRSPEAQTMLWSARDITTVGSGEGVAIGDATTNPEIVNAIVGLRHQKWPSEATARANAVQDEFNRILALVTARLDRQPMARLWRLFAAMLPEEMLCIVSWPACRAVMDEVLPNPRGLYGIQGHVLIRARFREVLGPEDSLAEHVRRSTFSWFLYEALNGATDQAALETTTLSVWPYQRQNKGFPSPRRNVESYRDVIRTADGGARPEDIIEALASDPNFLGINRGSLRQLIGEVRKMGLIEQRGSEVYPSTDGEELLQKDDPDPLVRRMIERVFPIAHLLKMFEAKAMSKAEAITYLRTIYPRWTSEFQPAQMVRWMEGLRLVKKDGGLLALSQYGRDWARRLPDPLPSFTVVETDDDEDDPAQTPKAAEVAPRPWPDLEQVLARFEAQRSTHGLIIEPGQLEALHNSLHCNDHKRFVILSGLSGTGKTQLMKTYAELFCQLMELVVDQHFQRIAVSPDWRDPTGLLGYVNELREDPVYQPGPALKLLLDAHRHPELPYFLLLDEMNLARVELYFAPFLSAMEDGGKLVLHTREPAVNEVPASIPWPRNLFILGSVNMDETTHPFSDKVLDRAFTMEFWDVDLKAFFELQPRRDPDTEQLLLDLHALLRPIRRHFGYRTAKELLRFVRLGPRAGTEAEAARNRLLDQAVFSKVLPRLRGENVPAMRSALAALEELLARRGLQRSARKIADMAQMLGSGVTGFWGT